MSKRDARRSRRDDYRAKRGTYGGMCLCPCPGEKRPPTMATFDPEDPYYSGDRTRKRARSADRAYETSIAGLKVTIRWSPKARRYERGVDHGPGLWVATVHGKSGGTLPGGSGISPYEAEQNTRKLLQGARASNDRTRRAARSCGWGAKLSGISRDRGGHKKLRYTLRSGKTLLGTITAVPDARGQFWWQSNISKDRGITTGLDKAIRLVLKDAGADARRHNVTLYDWTGRSRVVR